MDYIISPPEEPDWNWDADELATAITHRWGVDLGGLCLTECEIPMNGHELEVALHSEGQAISLGGYLEDAAEFAVWIRSITPADHVIWLYDQGFSNYVNLLQQTDVASILTAFSQ